MSVRALKWLASLPPDLMTSGEFRVMFSLCFHHNKRARPDLACFPSQELICKETGLSGSGLNKALNRLESSGLMDRKRGTIPNGKSRRTYYILGCDGAVDKSLTNSTTVESEGRELTPLSTELTPLRPPSNSTTVETKEYKEKKERVEPTALPADSGRSVLRGPVDISDVLSNFNATLRERGEHPKRKGGSWP